MSEKNILFEVDGFKVFENSTYVVKDKEDLSAPTGFVERGVTKLPSAGVGVTFPCRYVKTSEGKGVWDTGFWDYSPCYKNMDANAVKNLVAQLQKNLVVPYKRANGDDKALDQNDSTFWDSKRFFLESKQVLNTADVNDALLIYFALRTKNLTPENKIGDTYYKDSPYVLTDFHKNVQYKHEKSAKFSIATGVFESLLGSDKKKLVSVLNYLNMNISDKVDDNTLRGMFQQYLNQGGGTANVDTFTSTCEEASKESGIEKIALFVALKELAVTGGKFRKGTSGKYLYDGVEVGPDIRTSAQNIAKNKEFDKIKREILLDEE